MLSRKEGRREDFQKHEGWNAPGELAQDVRIVFDSLTNDNAFQWSLDGPDGRVTSCDITSSSGSPDLDEATCSNVTRRARFTPAMDGEGNPTSGSYSNGIRWVIPKD
mgnify:CR=1 FL=1